MPFGDPLQDWRVDGKMILDAVRREARCVHRCRVPIVVSIMVKYFYIPPVLLAPKHRDIRRP